MKCPACGYNPTLFMNVETGKNFKPGPGDYGICFNCGVKQSTDDKGNLILLSKEAEAELSFGDRQLLNTILRLWYEQRRMAS